MNEDIKKTFPEELNLEELSMVTGGDSALRSPSQPADADSSISVLACAKCRQVMSQNILHRYNGKYYCGACFEDVRNGYE